MPLTAHRKTPSSNVSVTGAFERLDRLSCQIREMHGPQERPVTEGPLAEELLKLNAAVDAEDFRVGISGALSADSIKSAVEHIGFDYHVERLFDRRPEGAAVGAEIAHSLGPDASDALLSSFMDASLAASLDRQSRAENRKRKASIPPTGFDQKFLVDVAAHFATELRELIFPTFESHVALMFLSLQASKGVVLEGWLAWAVVEAVAEGYRSALFMYGRLNLPSSSRARERVPKSAADLAAIRRGTAALNRLAKEGVQALEAGAKFWHPTEDRDE